MYKYCCRLNTGCVYSCGWIIRFCFSLMSFSFSLSFSTKCTSAILVLLKYSHKQLQDAGCISFTHVQQYPVLLCCYFPELKYFWIAKVSVVGQSAWKLHAKHYTRTVRSMGLGLRGGGGPGWPASPSSLCSCMLLSWMQIFFLPTRAFRIFWEG